MKNNFLKVLLILVLGYSCQKPSENTTTGNPFVAVAMTSSAADATVARNNHPPLWQLLMPRSYAFPPPATLLDSAGNNITIDAVWINFGQIEFKMDEVASGTEVDGDSVEFAGEYAVNLLESSPQSFVSGNINVALMRRVKIKLARTSVLPAGAPGDFTGKSIFISGTVNGNTFTYSTENETVIEIAGPMLVAAVENKTLLIELHLANLIKQIDLSSITSATNINDSNKVSATEPCPAIKSGAGELFTCFYEGIETQSDLGRDDDGDFVLDPDEDSVKN